MKINTPFRAFALAMAFGTGVSAQTVADFENLTLSPESYWNASAGGDGFTSGDAFFPTDYHTDWDFWQGGFAYSNVTDNTTAGAGNLYGVSAGAGYDGSSNFAVGQQNAVVRLGETAKSVLGFYVTNATYPALSMELGDDFAKQFGSPLNADGETDGTNGEDWFLLTVNGYLDGNQVAGVVEFYLADYRFANDEEDYIVTDWQWVDLSPLGDVDSVEFVLTSSDVGGFGMNTPAFYCIDNFTAEDITTGIASVSSTSLQAFPNPTFSVVNLSGMEGQHVRITDLSGRIMLNEAANAEVFRTFDVADFPAGIYLLEAWNATERSVIRLVKQ